MNEDKASAYGDERLPRYTSYPTAPHFSDAVTADVYARWLGELSPDLSASLYLHVPFCRQMCWYCGCNTTVMRSDAPISAYVAELCREIDTVAGCVPHPLTVGHVHFGGGTPTIVAPHEFLALMALLRRRFDLGPDAEIAVEIDPRRLERPMAQALGEGGVNRASLGVQSFDPVVQQAINRVQSYAVTAAAVEMLHEADITAVNFDLIYGLPHQTVQSCRETARQCLALRPARLSVFGYAHVPSFKPHQRLIDEAALPNGAERRRQAEAIAEVLCAGGYRRIGFDHYALPDDELSIAEREGRLHRNFQGYTSDACDVLVGFGASAIGRLPQGYVQNEPLPRRYSRLIGERGLATVKGYALTADDRLRADIIERLMCDLAVDVGAICARHGTDPAPLMNAPRLGDVVRDGLARIEGHVVRVPDEARFLVRTIAAAFDAYLGQGGRAHSRAV